MALHSSRVLLLILALAFPCVVLAAHDGEPAGKSDISLDKLKRTPQKKAGKNLFVTKSWGAAPQRSARQRSSATVTQPVQAPTAPVAPPLPFAYMGKMLDEESGRLVLYLAKGDVPYSVTVGEVIDGTYKVEAVSETELTLIYLPLNTKQKLIIGESDS